MKKPTPIPYLTPPRRRKQTKAQKIAAQAGSAAFVAAGKPGPLDDRYPQVPYHHRQPKPPNLPLKPGQQVPIKTLPGRKGQKLRKRFP